MIELVNLSTGDAGLVVNGQLVLSMDPDFENPSTVQEAAERLATALDVALVVINREPPPMSDWNWDDVLQALPSASGPTAAQADGQAAADLLPDTPKP